MLGAASALACSIGMRAAAADGASPGTRPAAAPRAGRSHGSAPPCLLP